VDDRQEQTWEVIGVRRDHQVHRRALGDPARILDVQQRFDFPTIHGFSGIRSIDHHLRIVGRKSKERPEVPHVLHVDVGNADHRDTLARTVDRGRCRVQRRDVIDGREIRWPDIEVPVRRIQFRCDSRFRGGPKRSQSSRHHPVRRLRMKTIERSDSLDHRC